MNVEIVNLARGLGCSLIWTYRLAYQEPTDWSREEPFLLLILLRISYPLEFYYFINLGARSQKLSAVKILFSLFLCSPKFFIFERFLVILSVTSYIHLMQYKCHFLLNTNYIHTYTQTQPFEFIRKYIDSFMT